MNHKVSSGTNVGVMILLALLAFGMINYLSARHYKRIDMTQVKIYSLSDQSKTIISELKEQVTIIVFVQPNNALYAPIRELIKQYEYHGGEKIQVEFVDPTRQFARAQMLAEKYKISDMNVVIFESSSKSKYVGNNEMAEYEYQGYLGAAQKLKAFKGEQAFTSAILNVTESAVPVIRVMTQHGEKQIQDPGPSGYQQVAELLKQNNFEVKEFSLLEEGAIPEGTDLVLIAGPKQAFVEPEVEALVNYFEQGGALLLLLDPYHENQLGALLEKYDVVVGNDVVVDPSKKLPFISPSNLFVTEYAPHPITEKMRGLATLFPLVRSVSVAEGNEEAVALAGTTQFGWGETSIEDPNFELNEEEDQKGPVSVAVAVEKVLEEDKKSRLVVIGDSDFIVNTQLPNLGNKDFLMNTIYWLIQQESKIEIGPKTPEQVRLTLNAKQMNAIFWQTVLGLPVLSLIIGGIILWRRRK